MNLEGLRKEINFKTMRSSGAGGQNVNKVETGVQLSWHVASSTQFSHDEKNRIAAKLAGRINKEGFLQIQNTTTRSQLQNKELALEQFFILLKKALYVAPPRKATKPSRAKVEKRLEAKKRQSIVKKLRGRIE